MARVQDDLDTAIGNWFGGAGGAAQAAPPAASSVDDQISSWFGEAPATAQQPEVKQQAELEAPGPTLRPLTQGEMGRGTFAAMGISDPVEDLFNQYELGQEPSTPPPDFIGPSGGFMDAATREQVLKRQVRTYLDPKTKNFRVDALDEVARLDPVMDSALKRLRQLKGISEEEAARRTPEEIEANFAALTRSTYELGKAASAGDQEARQMLRNLELPSAMPDMDLRNELYQHHAQPGIHRPAMTDEDVAAEMTGLVRQHVAEQYQKWHHEHPAAALTSEVAGSSLTFIPALRALGAVSKLGRLGRLTSQGAIAAREGAVFGGADLAMQGLQMAGGSRQDIDLGQAAIMGWTGGMANVLADATTRHLIQRNMQRIVREAGISPEAVSVESLQAQATAELMKGRFWKHVPNSLNMSSQAYAARFAEMVRSEMQRTAGSPETPDRDELLEIYGLVLNGLVGLADSATRSDPAIQARAEETMAASAKAAAKRMNDRLRARGKAPIDFEKAGQEQVSFKEAMEAAEREAAGPDVSRETVAPEAPGESPQNHLIGNDSGATSPGELPISSPEPVKAKPPENMEVQPAEPSLDDQIRAKVAPVEGAMQAGIGKTIKMLRSTLEWTPTEKIQARPQEMQFKSGTGQGGVVPEERLAGTYRHEPARPLLVWESKSGERVVVDGHHRLDLAQRTKEPELLTNIIRETDGWTQEEARAQGALANIRDGAGKVVDYANFFRHSKIEKSAAEAEGLLAKDKGRAGWALGRDAGQKLFNAFADGEITEGHARAIAEGAPGNDAVQEVAVQRVIEKKLGVGEARAFTQLVTDAAKTKPPVGKPSAKNLFGGSDDYERTLNEFEATAEAAAKTQRDLRSELTSLASGRTEKRAGQAAKANINVGDVEGVQKRAKELTAQIGDWENWHKSPELMDIAREKAGLPPTEKGKEFREARAAALKGEAPAPKKEEGGLFGAPKAEPKPPVTEAELAGKATYKIPKEARDEGERRAAETERENEALRSGKAPPRPEPTFEETSFRSVMKPSPDNYNHELDSTTLFETKLRARDTLAVRVQRALTSAMKVMAARGYDFKAEHLNPNSFSPAIARLWSAKSELLGSVSRWMKGELNIRGSTKTREIEARAAKDKGQVREVLKLIDEAISKAHYEKPGEATPKPKPAPEPVKEPEPEAPKPESSTDALRKELVDKGAPEAIIEAFDTIAKSRNGVKIGSGEGEVNTLKLERLDNLGMLDEVYDRAGRTRVIIKGQKPPKGFKTMGDPYDAAEIADTPAKQDEGAKIMRVAAEADNAMIVDPDGAPGGFLHGEMADLIIDKVVDRTIKVRNIKKIGKEQGSYEITTPDGKKFKVLVGNDAAHEALLTFKKQLAAERKRAGERGALYLPPMSLPEGVRKILNKQHEVAYQKLVLGAQKLVVGAADGIGRLVGLARSGHPGFPAASGREWGAAVRRGMGWHQDPKLQEILKQYETVRSLIDREIGQLIVDIDLIGRSTKNGEFLMRDAFDMLEGERPRELTAAEPGGRRSPKSKEYKPPPQQAELKDRAQPIQYDRDAAMAMARLVEHARDLFSRAGEDLVRLGRLAEEVRDEGYIDPNTGKQMVTVYYHGDMPPPEQRKGKLIGGFNYHNQKGYAPHLLPKDVRRRAMAAAFAEQAIRYQELGVPIFSGKASREAEGSYLKQRKLTTEEWARLGGIRDIRAVMPTLRHQLRLGAQLEFFRKVGEDAAWVVHDAPPDFKKIEEEIENKTQELKAFEKWMTKNRIPTALEMPTPPDLRQRRTKLERRAMKYELLFDEAGLPEHGMPQGWDGKDDSSKMLIQLQNDLRRIRQLAWPAANLERPLNTLPERAQAANAKLRALRDGLAAMKRQKSDGWKKLEGTQWGPLNEYGKRETWMRADVFGAQADEAVSLKGWGAAWNAALTIAKAAVTSENPATQLGNLLANLGINYLAGQRMNPNGVENYVKALKGLYEFHRTGTSNEKLVREFIEDSGLAMDSLTAEDLNVAGKSLRDWFNEPFEAAERQGTDKLAALVHGVVNIINYVKHDAPIVSKGFKAARGAYSFSDQVGELALYLTLRSGHGSSRPKLDHREAMDVVEQHYNQRNIPPVLRGYLGRRGALPFISWIYKQIGAVPRSVAMRDATGLLADIPARVVASMFKKPKTKQLVHSGVAMGMSVGQTIGKLILAWQAMHGAARMWAGMSEEEYDEALNERARGDSISKFMQVPVWFDDEEKDPKRRVEFLDATTLNPIGQIAKMSRPSPNPADNILTSIVRQNPITSGWLDFARNTDFFGKRLGQDETESRRGTAGRFYQGFLRPFVPGVARAFGEQDWEKHGVGRGILRSLGIKIEKADELALKEVQWFEMLREGEDAEWINTPHVKTLKGQIAHFDYNLTKLLKMVRDGDFGSKEFQGLSEWVKHAIEHGAEDDGD